MVLDQRRWRYVVWWNNGAMMSYERGGALVTTAATARLNAIIPGVDR